MQTIKHISIPQPCHELWHKMTPVDKGRHCAQCNKTVTDFTTMTNAEIINHLSNSQSVCGRFETYQLNSINNSLKMPGKSYFSWKKWALAASLTGLVPFMKAEAKPKFPIEQVLNSLPKVDTIHTGVLSRMELTGKVIMRGDTTPVADAIVKVRGWDFSTTTLADGTFKIKVPVDAATLEVHYIGYEAEDIEINQSIRNYNFILDQRHTIMLGGAISVLVIKRPPFYKRWWNSFIRIF